MALIENIATHPEKTLGLKLSIRNWNKVSEIFNKRNLEYYTKSIA